MRRILLIADGRSAITKGWLRMLRGLDVRVSLVSTFPCEEPHDADLVGILPVGFARLAGGQVGLSGQSGAGAGWKRRLIAAFRPALLGLRAWLSPLALGRYQKKLARIIEELKPDLVHALRIPFEGMLAASIPHEIPLIVSIWGNDLTLHARSSPLMAAWTRRTLQRANGLIADASRDIKLAKKWGLGADAPALLAPGNGGLDLAEMRQAAARADLSVELPVGRPLVINPRGFRPGSVHQASFFHSIRQVLKTMPDAFFVCTAMQGQAQAEKWVRDLGVQGSVLLLPYLPQQVLWQIYARSCVYVSLSSHDGTPNTFLEALACGCFPVVGDIASLREWLTHGENGLLVDPRDARAAAAAICRALRDEPLRRDAHAINQQMISDRAERSHVRQQVGEFLTAFWR